MPNTIKYIRPKKKTGMLLFLAKLNFTSKLSIFASLVLVLAGTFGLIFLRDSLDQSQDIRQQASVQDGTVEITYRLRDASDNRLKKGKNYVDFYVDTKSLQTDGIQLAFDVLTGAPGYSYQVDQVIGETPDFQIEAATGLQAAYQEIEKIDSGYSVATILLPTQISSTFSTSGATKFATLVIDYTGEDKMNGGILVPAAPITLGFIGERSIVTAHASNPPKDVLKPIALGGFQGASGSSLIGDDMCAMSGIGCEDQGTQNDDTENQATTSSGTTGTTSNSSATTNQATSSSTQTSSQSGTTTTSSNQTEEKTTTIGTGGTSTSTATSTTTATSTANSNTTSNSSYTTYTTTSATASCNQVCVNNHSCAAGLTCYASRCRNPLNLENTSCAQPTSQTLDTIAQRCNQACASHRDCPANMLCHSQSATCRLATNPGSLSCTPSTTKTIPGTTTPKGGSATESGSLGESATISAGINQNNNPFGSYTNKADEPILITEDDHESTPNGRFDFITSPLSRFTNGIQSMFGRIFPGVQTIFVWIGAIIFGIGLLLFSILFALFTRRKNSMSALVKKVDPETRAAQELAQKQLQERISALKTGGGIVPPVSTVSPISQVAPSSQVATVSSASPVAPSSSTTSVSPAIPVTPISPISPIAPTVPTTPAASITPTVPTSTPPLITPAPAAKPQPAAKTQTVPVIPLKPQGTQSQTVFQSNSRPVTIATQAPTPSSASSMLERMRNKGVTPPQASGINQSPIQDTKDS